MRSLLLVVYLFMIAMTPPLMSAHQDPLKPFRWDYRIILVLAPPPEVDDLASELVSSKTAINERQVLWFIFHGDAVATNYTESLSKKHLLSMVKRYFQKSEKRTQVLLIGKDGGVKSEADALNLNKLFALIDSMPMRQVEMRDAN